MIWYRFNAAKWSQFTIWFQVFLEEAEYIKTLYLKMSLEQTTSKILIYCSYLLFLSNLVKSQLSPSPCPKIFQYGQDRSGQIIGNIGIFSDNTQIVHLDVELSVANDATVRIFLYHFITFFLVWMFRFDFIQIK